MEGYVLQRHNILKLINSCHTKSLNKITMLYKERKANGHLGNELFHCCLEYKDRNKLKILNTAEIIKKQL